MTAMYQETRARITEFLEQYVRPSPESLMPDGCLTDDGIAFSIALLLDQDVFEHEYDLKRQALKDFYVITPDELFYRSRRKRKRTPPGK